MPVAGSSGEMSTVIRVRTVSWPSARARSRRGRNRATSSGVQPASCTAVIPVRLSRARAWSSRA